MTIISTTAFGKLLFVVAVLAATPFSRFQNLLYLERGLSASQVVRCDLLANVMVCHSWNNALQNYQGFLQLTLPFKAVGYFAWGVMADVVGLKWALVSCVVLSTLALEPFRWAFVYENFGLLFAAKALRTMLNAAWPLVDGFALKASRLSKYAEIRLWGSLSFGVSQVFVGSMLDLFYERSGGFSSIFALQYVLAVALLIMVVVLYPKNQADLEQPAASGWREVLGQAFRNPTLLSFLGSALVFGVAVSVSSQLLLVWTRKEFEKGAAFIGMLTLCSVSVGLLVFHYSARMLERFGARNLLLVAHAGHFARLAMYLLVTRANCTFALPIIETLHCFSFALYWTSASHMLHAVCAESVILVSNHSLLSLSHMTIGQGLGGFVFMQVYHAYGIMVAIAGGLLVTVASALLLLLVVPSKVEEARLTETINE